RNKLYNISSLTNYDNSSEGELEDIPDESYEPEQIYDQKENITSVMECMKLLSSDHKTVLVLRDIQGFSYEDISQILNCSVGTVKSRINRARFKLKEIIVSSMEHI
ncbi:MAG: sigma-70 family RNA polymerase sigma factor, partial [Clostridiales bacterium]|nr:sigma-70 family RNA polymerase sigma factor [Clostridiales bacterium]